MNLAVKPLTCLQREEVEVVDANFGKHADFEKIDTLLRRTRRHWHFDDRFRFRHFDIWLGHLA